MDRNAPRAFDPVTSFYPMLAERSRDYGVYGVDFNTLAASSPGQEASFNIDRDSDFIVLGIAGVETTDTTASTEQSFWEILMQVQDNGSGQNWYNSPQAMVNVVGRNAVDGHGPLWLPRPRWINAGSTVTVTLRNLEATARRVFVSFHGEKAYRGMRPGTGGGGDVTMDQREAFDNRRRR